MTKTRTLLALGCGLALMLALSPSASATHGDFFFLIKKEIVMEEIDLELPVPDYEMVDVAGDFKNAPDSVACGGPVNEGAAEDADDCLLRPQLTFTDGYLDTDGTVVTPNATAYNGKHGGQFKIIAHVGDVLQLTVKNEMPEAVNGEAIETGFYAPADNLQIIHWHGMELDNESDGTPVSEFGIEPGEQRLYQYRLYRPGNYWFHPHVLPLLTEARGQIGQLIVRSYEEDLLTLHGVLPLQYKAFTLSDSTVANETNRFLLRNGILFEHFNDEEVNNNLMPDISPDLDGNGECDRGAQIADCIVNEGELVLVNGIVPTSDGNVPTVYIPEGRAARVAFINSSNERFYRFRLLLDGEEPPFGSAQRVNTGSTGECYAGVGQPKFSGADPLSCEQGLTLYRIGGQNGLLDHVRVEGQPELAPGEPPRAFDTVIRTGEDFIGPSERTEFLVVPKDRNGDYLEPGEEMFIWNVDYPHGRFTAFFDNTIGNGDSNNRDVTARKLVRIKVVQNFLGLPNFDVAAGDPIMAHPVANRPTEDIKGLPTDQLSAVPAGNDPFLGVPFKGTDDPAFVLGNRVSNGTRFPAINANKGAYTGAGDNGDQLPTQDSTRYARAGDVIEFVYANDTFAAHHPFHMHGFSFQPISIHDFESVDTDGDGIDDSANLIDPPLHVFDYNEFVDVEVMQPGKALKYRMKVNDRFKIPDDTEFSYFQLLSKFPYDQSEPYGGPGDIEGVTSAEMGGALGRWLFHCHILHHAALGMISDLCIAPPGAADASACKIDVDENIYQPIL